MISPITCCFESVLVRLCRYCCLLRCVRSKKMFEAIFCIGNASYLLSVLTLTNATNFYQCKLTELPGH